MGCFFLKAGAVLAATAAAATTYVSVAPLPAGIFSSPAFRWVAANVIFFWLLYSYRQHRTAAASSAGGHADDVSAVMSVLYPSSEHDAFAAAVAVDPVSTKQPREARAATRADRPRVRKESAGEEKPRAISGAAAATKSHGKKQGDDRPRTVAGKAKPGVEWLRTVAGEAKPGEDRPRTFAGEAKPGVEWPRTVAGEAKPSEDGPRTVVGEAKPDDADESIDSMWLAIVRRGAARPVAVPKSETWSGDELPRLERAAERATATREMRKSASLVPSSPPHPAAAAAANQPGWRTRDVLVMPNDVELLRRAESLIRRHHEHQRLQRQESEQRQAEALEYQRRRALALIRV